MVSSLLLLWLVVLTCGVLGESANVREGLRPQLRKFSIHFPWWTPDKSETGKGEKSEEKVVFRLFNRDNLNSPEVVDSLNMHSFTPLSPGKPIKMIIHGWKGYGNCTFTRTMSEALLQRDVNLIAVDWSGYGSRSMLYPIVRGHVGEVAFHVAKFLDLLADSARVNLGSVHILGHSLGGQIAGVAGLLVKKGKIGRISGFDPAGPTFSMKDISGRLSPDAANFVDVIHTTASTLGFGEPIGHVDFYPNGGHAIQPGCGMDVIGKCSHRRSYEYFVESLAHPVGFPAVSCQDWQHFLKKECDGTNVVLMGIETHKSARGVYFLQTNKASPFRRDQLGLSYSAL